MINAVVMKSKHVKGLQKVMLERYGSIIQGVFYTGSNRKIYLATEPTTLVNLRSVNAEGVGVYIGRLEKEGFRPSIEGAQLLRAKKNTYELNDEQLWDWLRGFKIEVSEELNGYHIITYKGDTLGCGKAVNGSMWNYTPKERRIKSLRE